MKGSDEEESVVRLLECSENRVAAEKRVHRSSKVHVDEGCPDEEARELAAMCLETADELQRVGVWFMKDGVSIKKLSRKA